jgi:hypothetical protein
MKTPSWRSIPAMVVAGIGLLGAVAAVATIASVPAPPSIETFAVPASLHHLQATVEHSTANMDVLRKIGPGFAEGYQVDSATYIFTAPDRLEMHAKAGMLTATQIYTNTTRETVFGWIHRTDDISKDITKRETIEVLGLLPQNYLDTMRADYIGVDTVDGVQCQVFMLRYLTDQPNDNRRFQTWVSDDQHYIVKQRVWDGGNNEHQTVLYKNPIQVIPGVWVPTRVEAYDSQGELAGVAMQKNISAS